MRYCRFQHASGAQFGRIESVNGVDTITGLLSFPGHNSTLAETKLEPYPLSQAKLLAPVVPSKIVCVGRNYREHAVELGHDIPDEPLIFLKPPSSLIASGDAIQLPPATVSQRMDYEGELGVIIGRRCGKLEEGEDVVGYIRGYTCVNDVTARDLQKKDSQWTRAKGFDTFCPVGPIVVTADEFDASACDVSTHLNGEHRQHGNTRDFIFPLGVIIRYISHIMTLEPGDLISTGTPAGVSPMKSGDVVEVTVQGIGTLKNIVR